MTRLDGWLGQAVRNLSKEAAAQVRSEIGQHYESAREAAVAGGASIEEADQVAVKALGDAKIANSEYRKVMLTRSEARLLRESNWEARVICSRPFMTLLILAIPTAALLAAAILWLNGAATLARILLVGGIGMGFLFGTPTLLPIYTPRRGRMFRYVKWAVIVGVLAMAFGQDALKWSWLLLSCLWPMAWIERRRVSIRRKLPVARWPKQLYL